VEKDFKIITSRDGSIKKLPRGKETKNHNRTVYLIPKILDMLSLSSKESNSEWLFTPMGKKTPYQDSQTLSEGYFRPALQKMGVPYKGFYNTRHTFLTITDEMNLNPKFINLMAGHKEDSKVGEKHYINRQVTEASAKSALNQLEPFQRLIYGE
jgi:integrase